MINLWNDPRTNMLFTAIDYKNKTIVLLKQGFYQDNTTYLDYLFTLKKLFLLRRAYPC